MTARIQRLLVCPGIVTPHLSLTVVIPSPNEVSGRGICSCRALNYARIASPSSTNFFSSSIPASSNEFVTAARPFSTLVIT